MPTWLEPSIGEQSRILASALALIVRHAEEADELLCSPLLDAQTLRDELEELNVEAPRDEVAAIELVTRLLREGTVHTTSPSYFGLFNPTPSLMSVVADAIVAAYNPQLAVWSHAPAANEIEAWLIEFFAHRLGLISPVGGSFTSGGAEANAQALHLALTHSFPNFGDEGLRSVGADPVLYASSESHLAWLKIAHVCGIGRDAVRLVPVDRHHRIDIGALEQMVTADRRRGREPVLIVATAGTTSAGVIDPLEQVGSVARRHGAWYHVDAAWGGAACLSERLRPCLAGIQTADSVTLDAHKWLSVSMGAGMFITQRPQMLGETYRVSTSYMPGRVGDTSDPYTTSNQWSRRFIGLKLLLTLLTAGRSGYAAQLEHDADLGQLLRLRLMEGGWAIVNDTPLPVVCAVDTERPDDAEHHQRIVDNIVDTGRAWISTTLVGGRPAIRMCVISHRTTERHIDQLVDLLDRERAGQ